MAKAATREKQTTRMTVTNKRVFFLGYRITFIPFA